MLAKNIVTLKSLELSIGVDAIGPETDFAIEKYWKNGHQVATEWSLYGHGVTRWSLSGQKEVVS